MFELDYRTNIADRLAEYVAANFPSGILQNKNKKNKSGEKKVVEIGRIERSENDVFSFCIKTKDGRVMGELFLDGFGKYGFVGPVRFEGNDGLRIVGKGKQVNIPLSDNRASILKNVGDGVWKAERPATMMVKGEEISYIQRLSWEYNGDDRLPIKSYEQEDNFDATCLFPGWAGGKEDAFCEYVDRPQEYLLKEENKKQQPKPSSKSGYFLLAGLMIFGCCLAFCSNKNKDIEIDSLPTQSNPNALPETQTPGVDDSKTSAKEQTPLGTQKESNVPSVSVSVERRIKSAIASVSFDKGIYSKMYE